jgi:NAD(P)-dependent dehydrogenase (short-subunit alcohol dehydrogenase family)
VASEVGSAPKTDRNLTRATDPTAGFRIDVTKGAVNAMTMAMDLGEHGIRVNAVAPGVTHTSRSDAMLGTPRYRATEERNPLRHFGTVGDIAVAVAFLASDEASDITGARSTSTRARPPT